MIPCYSYLNDSIAHMVPSEYAALRRVFGKHKVSELVQKPTAAGLLVAAYCFKYIPCAGVFVGIYFGERTGTAL